MHRNIEIKARIPDPTRTLELIRGLIDTEPKLLEQEDIFFQVPQGRLKLRLLGHGGELIAYDRPDATGPKLSHYQVVPFADPVPIRNLLTMTLGVRAVVKKRRQLFLVGRTRIHLDDVEGLGHFLELEVVLSEQENPEDGERVARELMDSLQIESSQLLESAYVDLLERRS